LVLGVLGEEFPPLGGNASLPHSEKIASTFLKKVSKNFFPGLKTNKREISKREIFSLSVPWN
jgi:hypothetical protein